MNIISTTSEKFINISARPNGLNILYAGLQKNEAIVSRQPVSTGKLYILGRSLDTKTNNIVSYASVGAAIDDLAIQYNSVIDGYMTAVGNNPLPEATTLFNAMTVQPTDTNKVAISKMIYQLKQAGLWDKMETLWVLAAHDEQSSKLNWKNPSTYTLSLVTGTVGTAVFTPNREWSFPRTGNTSADSVDYFQTNFNFSTNLTITNPANDLAVSLFKRDNGQNSRIHFGTGYGLDSQILCELGNIRVTGAERIGNTLEALAPGVSRRLGGLILIQREDTTTCGVYYKQKYYTFTQTHTKATNGTLTFPGVRGTWTQDNGSEPASVVCISRKFTLQESKTFEKIINEYMMDLGNPSITL